MIVASGVGVRYRPGSLQAPFCSLSLARAVKSICWKGRNFVLDLWLRSLISLTKRYISLGKRCISFGKRCTGPLTSPSSYPLECTTTFSSFPPLTSRTSRLISTAVDAPGAHCPSWHHTERERASTSSMRRGHINIPTTLPFPLSQLSYILTTNLNHRGCAHNMTSLGQAKLILALSYVILPASSSSSSVSVTSSLANIVHGQNLFDMSIFAVAWCSAY